MYTLLKFFELRNKIKIFYYCLIATYISMEPTHQQNPILPSPIEEIPNPYLQPPSGYANTNIDIDIETFRNLISSFISTKEIACLSFVIYLKS
jgi:hypothetical protein